MKHTEEIFIVQSMVSKGFFYGTIMARDWEDTEYKEGILEFVKMAQSFMFEENEISFNIIEKKFIDIRNDFAEWCHEREKDDALFFDNFQLIINSSYKNQTEKPLDVSKVVNLENCVEKETEKTV